MFEMTAYNFWSRAFNDIVKLLIVFVNKEIVFHKDFTKNVCNYSTIYNCWNYIQDSNSSSFHGLNVGISCGNVKMKI